MLATGRIPVAGAEVVAYRAGEGDARGMMSLLTGGTPGSGPKLDALKARTSGPVLARATVAADATFELHSPERHVWLALRDDLYGLDMPEVVHVPAATHSTDVVLMPYLGGCLRGRLLGHAAGVATVRLLLEPDPAVAMRNPNAFFGAMLNGVRGPEPPGEGGTFVFRAVPAAGELFVLAEGNGVAGRNRLAALQPGETREIALPVDDAAALTVRVVDASDQPLAHARVDAWPADAGPVSDAVRIGTSLHVDTDATGAAVLRPLLPGRWEVAAQLRGWLDAEGAAELPRDETLVLRLRDGGAVAGIVVDEHGAPLADARVATSPVMKVPMFGDLAEQIGADALAKAAADGVRTTADGSFRIAGVDPGAPCLVIAAHDGFVAGIARDVAAGRTDVRIELQRAAALAGRAVAAESDAPLSEFTAEVQTTMFLAITRPVQRVAVHGAADGAFRIDGLPTGNLTLALAAEGRPETHTTVALRAGQTTDVGAVRLPRGAAVRGLVRDADGNRIARALVQLARGGLADNPALALLQPAAASTRTDDRGEFALTDLPPGRQQLLASAEGFASARSERLQLAAGAETGGVEIVLDHGGRIAGTLKVAAGASPDEFLLIVQDQGSQKTHPAALAAGGSFHADNLDPGRYQVQAMRSSLMTTLQAGRGARQDKPPDVGKLMAAVSENTVTARCVVRAGETTEVTLDASELAAGTRLLLRVLVGGRPLEEGMVEATMVDGGSTRFSLVQRGDASIPGLDAGRVRVQLRGGVAMTPIGAGQDLVIPPGTDEHRATIDLPGGELRGRVVDVQTGNPLPTALVRLVANDAAGGNETPAMAITDGKGEFVFAALAPGSYSLVAADDLVRGADGGNASRVDGLRIAGGESVTGIELRAHPAAGLTVTVTDDAGLPVAGAMLLAVDPDGRPLGGLAIAASAHDGRATLAGLPGGALRIVGRAPGLAPDASAVLELAPAEHRDAELRLHSGTRVCVDAVGRDGRALRGADVSARCNDGPWFPALLLLESRGADGRLELGRLAPGAWEFRITHPAVGTFTVRRAIPGGGTVTVLATPP